MDYDGAYIVQLLHCLLTPSTGWFSVTPENIALQIAERCRSVSLQATNPIS